MATELQRSNAQAQTENWLSGLTEAFARRDSDAVTNLFTEDGFWRDLVAFTWNVTTLEGRAQIAPMVKAVMDSVAPVSWSLTAGHEPTEADGVVEAWIEFETAVVRGNGIVRLRDGKAWTLLTNIQEIKGHEEPLGRRRAVGAEHGVNRNRVTWLERREAERRELGYSKQPFVLIVGGGHAGTALGARLRQLDVPTIIVDRHARPGDQWRKRYKTLTLHDPVWYDHMPYLKFPENWPIFSAKDKIADWLEAYTSIMELNYWCNTDATSAVYDEKAGEWVVSLVRDGKQVTVRPKHVVMATGIAGKPLTPEFPGQDVFRGDQHHSTNHPESDKYAGKRAVVIGANNSAFDIATALWEAGAASVTMVQRSSVLVVSSKMVLEDMMKPIFSEEALAAGLTTEDADLAVASLPYRVMTEAHKPFFKQIADDNAEYYSQLEAAGLRLDWGEDGSGQTIKVLRRAGGYYIDVGATELLVNGEVKVVHGNVDHMDEEAVVLDDGTRLPADVVVYATGYTNASTAIADLYTQEIADKVGPIWGLGSDTAYDPGPWEGELKNMWKPTKVEGLWFHAGNFGISRFHSLHLALQLKARAVGMPTEVYRNPQV